MFQALDSVSLLDVEQLGGVSGTTDSTGILLTFSATVTSLTADDIIITNRTGSVTKGIVIGVGDTWTIVLNNVTAEGEVKVEVRHFGDFYISNNTRENVDVYKGPEYIPPDIPTTPPDYTPSSVVIEGKIVVSGTDAGLTDDQFDFTIYDEYSNIVATGKNDANGNIIFTPIEYTEPGHHTYIVVITTPGGNGWITDGREFIVIVDVTNQDGTLICNITYTNGEIPTFHNRHYSSEPWHQIVPSITTPFIDDHIAYINGYPDATVRPEQSISRAEVTIVFYRLLTAELRDVSQGYDNNFPDVDSDLWYSDAISAINYLGIINGYPDGSFQPDGSITRAELATIAAHFAAMMQMSPLNHLSFSDVDAHWAQLDIEYAAAIGWVNGYEDGTFRPDNYITRAEFITLVNRVLRRIPETYDDLLVDEMVTWVDNADIEMWYYLAIQEASNSHEAEYKEDLVRGLLFGYEYWISMISP